MNHRALLPILAGALTLAAAAWAGQAPPPPADPQSKAEGRALAGSPEPSLPALTGRVVDTDGRPLAGVEILGPSEEGRSHRRLAVSGPDGTFAVRAQTDLTFGYIAVCLPGWLEENLSYEEGVPRAPVELRLGRPARLGGRVIDSQGQPVEGIKLSVEFVGPGKASYCEEDPHFRTGVTDAEGRFSFDGLEPGRYRVGGVAPNYGPLQAEPVERAREAELVIPGDWATLEGRIFDAEGAPVEGALIHTSSLLPDPVLTDATGAYRISRVAQGQAKFRVSHPTAGWGEDFIEVSGRTLRHDFRLPRLTPLEGRILGSDGSPVANPSLTVASRPIEVGADGRFRTAVPPGWHQLDVQASGWGPAREGITVGDEPFDVEIRLPRPALIRGRVTGLSPGESAHVELKKSLGSYEGGRPDARGCFQLYAFTPGDRTLIAFSNGRRLERRIHVDEGTEIMVEDFRFSPLPRVRGRVLDPEGRPLTLATDVILFLPRDRKEHLELEDDGTFEVFLTPGTWTILVDQAGFGPASMVFSVTDDPVDLADLRLAQEVTVSGSIGGLAPGEEVGGVYAVSEEGTWQRFAPVDDENRFRLPRLRLGNWTLKAESTKKREIVAPLRILPGAREVHADLDFAGAEKRVEPGQ
jgi:protocatechuate 3,4-dioxygenase beta subunit